MNNPALKGEVSTNKMLTTLNPRLRRSNVVLDSFHSGISNAPEKLPRTPKMSLSKIISQPRMFFHKLKGAISFKQIKSFAHTHSWRKLNKQMDMVNSDMKFIDFASMPECNLIDESLTIHLDPIKLQRVFSIFRFPDKMESILSKAMFKTFQIHFSSPEDSSHYLRNLFKEGKINPPYTEELNINKEDGNSSLCLKAQVSLP